MKQNKSQVAVKKEKVARMSENGPAAVASTSGLCKKGGPIPVDTESEIGFFLVKIVKIFLS
jgi:hypothetical protein